MHAGLELTVSHKNKLYFDAIFQGTDPSDPGSTPKKPNLTRRAGAHASSERCCIWGACRAVRVGEGISCLTHEFYDRLLLVVCCFSALFPPQSKPRLTVGKPKVKAAEQKLKACGVECFGGTLPLATGGCQPDFIVVECAEGVPKKTSVQICSRDLLRRGSGSFF